MHNSLVIALRKLACRHSNDEAVVYGECRDIDNHEVVGEVGMAHFDEWTVPVVTLAGPRCHAIASPNQLHPHQEQSAIHIPDTYPSLLLS